MAVTINADDGSVSGSAGLKQAADATGVLALQTNGTAAVTIGTDQNTVFNSTGAITLSSGTTAQRPGSPVFGMIRGNTTESKYEVYTSAGWQILTSTAYPYNIDCLVVAGGGGGGADSTSGGG